MTAKAQVPMLKAVSRRSTPRDRTGSGRAKAIQCTLTAAQYDRLPGTAQAIVDTDRSIAAIVNQAVVPIHVAKPGGALRGLLQDRRVLTSRADAIWGKPLRSDGTALA